MKNKQTAYWVILVVVLGSLLASFYWLQRNRPAPTDRPPSDLATVRAYLDDAAPSVNTTLAHQVMDKAVEAQTAGKLGDDAVDQMDAVMDAATADKVVMDDELLQVADILARDAYGRSVRSRADLRTLLSR